MKINKEWHSKHPMPKNATLDQRIEWHIQHAKACQCRKMPDSIQKEIRRRKEE
jgi:hypothetical protein